LIYIYFVDVALVQLTGVPKSLFGKDLIFELKRGAKAENSKHSHKLTADSTLLDWKGEKLRFECNFEQNPKTKKFEDKKKVLQFSLKEVITPDYILSLFLQEEKEISKDPKKEKKAKLSPVGKGSINLETYATAAAATQINIPITVEKKYAEKQNVVLQV
jgi:hypothetical protein